MDFLEDLSQEDLASIDEAERSLGKPENKKSKTN